MAKHEVTQAQWAAVMGTTVRQKRDETAKIWDFGPSLWSREERWPLCGEGDDYPMYYVTWDDAQAFCGKVGHGMRLPTEAEWEYACRAGRKGAFEGEWRPGKVCWHRGSKAQPVGQLRPNAWGLHDMHGNVAEWCADWFEPYSRRSAKNPKGAKEGDWRVCRGGSWTSSSSSCRAATRSYMAPNGQYNTLGFRPCCSK